MRSPDNNEMHKANSRGKRKPSENAPHPQPLSDGREAEADWDDEIQLNQILERLPNAPLSSNFTSRVMSQVRNEALARSRNPWRANWNSFVDSFRSREWTQRFALSAAVVLAAFVCFIQYQASGRKEVAQSVVAVSSVADLPSLDVLVNFDAIKRLPKKSGEVDVELLAALK